MVVSKRALEEARRMDRLILELLDKRARLLSRIPSDRLEERLAMRRAQTDASGTILEDRFIQDLYAGLYDQAVSRETVPVAFLGPLATFSHQAVDVLFGGGATLMPRESLVDVFESVEGHTARFGVVPVENSVEGGINLTLDLLRESNLQIYGDMTLPVVHHLIGQGRISGIREVYSHPQVLAQCRDWLRKNLPQARQIESESSAAAVGRIRNLKGRAAIGTRLAAQLYHRRILATGIQDSRYNRTRFLVLSREASAPGKSNRTSIVFLCEDKPGALLECLKIFKIYGINLTRIESRPSRRRNWEYTFFVDFLGHCNDSPVAKALARLRRKTIYVKIMGSYPTHASGLS